jgi:hypothetical protein
MELLIIFLIALIIVVLVKVGRKTNTHVQSKNISKEENDAALNERRRKQQEIDELITVVLPTIKNK